MDPPPSDEFAAWAAAHLHIDPKSQADKNWINTNVSAARSHIQSNWILARIHDFISDNHAWNKVSPLNIITTDLEFNIKSFDSIMSKLFRINILDNEQFPDPPKAGWVDSTNLFWQINDLVRTTVTCRFFDEPKKISGALADIAREHDLEVVVKPQAREVGYYAFHIYIRFPLILLNQQWEEFDASVQFEIQVTTEMQYLLYALTHRFYENERHQKLSDQVDWRWSHDTPRFSATYISHSLHLLEGLIQRLYEDAGNDRGEAHAADSDDEARLANNLAESPQ